MKTIKYLLLVVMLLSVSHPAYTQWGSNIELTDYPLHSQVGVGIPNGDYLYAINVLGLMVFSIEDIDHPEPLTFLPIPDQTRSIVYYEDYLYIHSTGMDHDNTIYIVDVSEPLEPTIVRVWRGEEVSNKLWINGDRLYMCVREQGLIRYSLDDPVEPEALPHPLDAFSRYTINDMAFHSDGVYAVAVSRETSKVIDLSGERMIDYAHFDEFEGIVAFAGDVLCGVYHDYLYLFDFSEPERVSPLSINRIGGELLINGNYWVQDDHVFIVHGNTLNSVNISDPEDPRIVGELEFEEFRSSLVGCAPFARIRDRMLLLDTYTTSPTYFTDRIQVIDTSDPTDLSITGEFTSQRINFGYACIQNNSVYNLYGNSQGSSGLVELWNIEDWDNPERMSLYPDPENSWGVSGFKPVGDLCYVGRYYDHVSYLNVVSYENPAEPELLNEIEVPNTIINHIALSENFLYTSGYDGLDIFSIENPEQPVHQRFIENEFLLTNLEINNDMLISEHGRTLRIYDLADPVEPQLLNSDSLVYIVCAFSLDSEFIYTVTREVLEDETRMRLHVHWIDSTEHELVQMGVSQGESVPRNSGDTDVTVGEDGLALVTLPRHGLLVYDTKDPFEPHLIATYPTMYLSNQSMWHNGTIILNESAGMGIYNLTLTDGSPAVHPDRLDFPATLIDQRSELELNLSNSAEEGLIHVTGLEIEGDGFSVRDRGRWLTPEEDWQVAVTFQPAEEGNYEGTLLIEVEGNEVIEVPLSGRGVTEIVTEENTLQPLQLEMHAAYPNPFNSTTTIRYGLPYPGNVSLQLYNLAGQQIITLFEGHKQPGIHTTTLTATDLPSGLYFVRLKASDQVFTQKVMLIR